MPDLTAKRTLVKSPPELWEELSEVERLAKHLGAFGEIKITKLEPEHTVAWEGEHASGTVSIEPSGWGTKVTLHAELPEEPPPEPAAEEPVADEPAATPEHADLLEVGHPGSGYGNQGHPPAGEPVAEERAVVPERTRRGFWGWLFRTRTGGSASEVPQPEDAPDEEVQVEAPPVVEPPVEEPAIGELRAEASEAALADAEPVDDEPDTVDPQRARAILDEALDALGAAHHRPFSRG